VAAEIEQQYVQKERAIDIIERLAPCRDPRNFGARTKGSAATGGVSGS